MATPPPLLALAATCRTVHEALEACSLIEVRGAALALGACAMVCAVEGPAQRVSTTINTTFMTVLPVAACTLPTPAVVAAATTLAISSLMVTAFFAPQEERAAGAGDSCVALASRLRRAVAVELEGQSLDSSHAHTFAHLVSAVRPRHLCQVRNLA